LLTVDERFGNGGQRQGEVACGRGKWEWQNEGTMDRSLNHVPRFSFSFAFSSIIARARCLLHRYIV
jgi:hypothetical protein